MSKKENTTLFKKILKIAIKSILYLIAFLILYLIMTFILSRMTVSAEADTAEDIDIYILSNGIHVDLVLPSNTTAVNWFDKIPHWKSKIDSSEYKHVAIGWGDKGFYINTPTWAELKASTAIKAAFGISGSAIHATYYRSMRQNDQCKKISISHDQYQRLIAFILESFDKDPSGNSKKIETNTNKGITDAFYEAKGRYSIFNTCNSWTNRGLKVSGQKACVWTAFEKGIFLKYQDD